MLWYSGQKRVLALDIDDVLVVGFQAIADYHNLRFGTNIKISDFTSYAFWEAMGCDKADGLRRCMDYFMSSYAGEVSPLQGAQEVVSLLAEEFHLVCITGRPHQSETLTRQLLDRHFPSHIQQIFCTASVFPDPNIPRKGEVCRSVKALALIDDNADYARECGGTELLLFGEYPWNEQSTLPRLRDWRAVAEHFFKAGS